MVGDARNKTEVTIDVDALQKLELLTHELPPLQYLTQRVGTAWVEYSVRNGYCLGLGLYKNEEAAVQRSIMTAGTVFPQHRHPDAIEILIVTHGSLTIFENAQEKRTISIGELHSFARGIPHSIQALEDTRLIGITVPAGEGYPDAT